MQIRTRLLVKHHLVRSLLGGGADHGAFTRERRLDLLDSSLSGFFLLSRKHESILQGLRLGGIEHPFVGLGWHLGQFL